MSTEQEMFEKHKAITDKVSADFDEKVKAEEARRKEEARGASPESSTEKDKDQSKEKDEKKDKAAQAQAQAEKDEKILSTEEKDLSEEDKARKIELLKTKKAKEDAGKAEEDKKKKTQENLDKRFAELTGKIKDLERDKETNKVEIEKLKKEKAELEKKEAPQKEADKAVAAEKTRVEKYLEEDKEKPREERREMTKEELEEWLLDDYAAASEWLSERTLRRHHDREAFKKAGSLEASHKESFEKVLKKHPEIDFQKMDVRIKELEKEGKSKEEIGKALIKEMPKTALSYLIMTQHPEWEKETNAPELVMAELEKQLEKKPEKKEEPKGKTYTDEEVEKIKQDAIKQANEEEEERKRKIDEGDTSSRGKPAKKEGDLSPAMEAKKRELLKRTNTSEKEFDDSVKRRQKIGAM